MSSIKFVEEIRIKTRSPEFVLTALSNENLIILERTSSGSGDLSIFTKLNNPSQRPAK